MGSYSQENRELVITHLELSKIIVFDILTTLCLQWSHKTLLDVTVTVNYDDRSFNLPNICTNG